MQICLEHPVPLKPIAPSPTDHSGTVRKRILGTKESRN